MSHWQIVCHFSFSIPSLGSSCRAMPFTSHPKSNCLFILVPRLVFSLHLLYINRHPKVCLAYYCKVDAFSEEDLTLVLETSFRIVCCQCCDTSLVAAAPLLEATLYSLSALLLKYIPSKPCPLFLQDRILALGSLEVTCNRHTYQALVIAKAQELWRCGKVMDINGSPDSALRPAG